MGAVDTLQVFICGELAGSLTRDADGELGFSYDPSYRGPQISIGMMPDAGEFQGRRVHAWFAGLLPDNIDVRRGMAAVAQCGPNSVFGLLSAYGMDLPGAVQVLSPDSAGPAFAREAAYSRTTPEIIRRRLEVLADSERQQHATIWMSAGERWSLGGNQAKIALREFDGMWYECMGSAASNVIVKPGIPWLNSQALDECICMRLAKRVGLPVADVRLQSFDGFDAIVVERYDRITGADGWVRRIHQEDACQALGVVPEKKYAADGGPSSAAVMNLVMGDSTGNGPNLFFDALVFNYLLAATDAHAKNYSLLHTTRGAYRLAPLYDVASIVPYMKKGEVYRLAMSIGGENRVGWLRKSSLTRFARLHGLDWLKLANRVDAMAERVKASVESAVNDFSACDGADELGSLLVPRVQALCDAAQRNIRVDGRSFKPVDVSRMQPTGDAPGR